MYLEESTKQKCETAFSEPTHRNKLGFTQSALNSTPHLCYYMYIFGMNNEKTIIMTGFFFYL